MGFLHMNYAKHSHAKLLIFFFSVLFLSVACAPRSIGRRFSINAATNIKVGHDQKRDVLTKLGPPVRRIIDGSGCEIFTYLWANGKGAGYKSIIAFNKNQIVSLVEIIQ
jgi:hypothetical protein